MYSQLLVAVKRHNDVPTVVVYAPRPSFCGLKTNEMHCARFLPSYRCVYGGALVQTEIKNSAGRHDEISGVGVAAVVEDGRSNPV